ncbi:acyltransferase family protein [Streptomyces turgidiscabies]|uniref:Acetyltransferase family protein n=1 Tax=Streptomyces turgidiscabies (strain Car8) TaxID=698760 RepID=L7ETV1_STRT8|nr:MULTISPECIES: acyltransferase [Streptomyces]ELP62314.1 acetyltransferase family protein [Streptomyces turgidiscabies Car8]MDX3498710.1 acyltransferase [Streptomyces turgidiscabies]GAQ74863.1 O-acetyltransferase OatA [Streptomyces turgidiscabies]
MSTPTNRSTADAVDATPSAGATVEVAEESPRILGGAPTTDARPRSGGGRGFPSALRGGGRVAGLDGLRTVAVVLVIVYHVKPDLVPGGSVGVDVFFTLSGFVITRLLIAEYARTGGIGLRSFYKRRWVRLGPAMLTMCAVTALLSLALPLPLFDGAWTAAVLAAVSVVNLVRAGEAGPYSDLTSPLSHTWSLGVEEQFYLAWPLLFLLLLRRTTARKVLAWVGALCVVPLLWRLALWDPSAAHRIYNGPDTRADQLLIGALLAVVLARLRADDPRLELLRRWSGHLCWPALALLGLVAWQIPIAEASAWNPVWYTVGFSFAAVLTATVVATLDLLPGSWPSRLLSIGALAWVGRNLSYGMYLWHYPAIRLLSDLGVPDDQLLPMGMVATVAAALASYALVERPLARRARRGGGRPDRPDGALLGGSVVSH